MGLDNRCNHYTDPVTIARSRVEYARNELEKAERQLDALLNPADYTRITPEERFRQGF